MIKLSISFFSGLLAALICLAPLQAQTGTDAAVQSGAPAAAQAPDDMTKKITALVDAGKYAEAQALTTGLLVAYPDDQRLIKAKALLDKLLAPSSTPSAAPEDAQKQWSASANVAQLSGEDQLNYSALIELARESQQSSDLDEQHRLLKQFMEQSNAFLKRHPEQMMLWQLRAAAAIGLVEPMDGFEAGQKLLAAGAMDSNDPALRQLLVKLKLAGWLDKDKVTGLQLNADDTRRQQAAAAEQERQNAERAQYTFPAAHSNAFHYEYGHITIDENGAVYVGSDQTIHMLRTDMREVKAYCVTWICGLYFTPKSGRKYFIVAITEDAASSKQLQKEGLRPASVLGNAVVSKWKFVVSADNKTLTPPTNMAGMPPHR